MTIERMDAFFNQRAETYDNHMLVELDLSEFYGAVADCFPERSGEVSLLDLGCGTGLELSRLYEKMPGLCVTGVDLSREMLKVLKRNHPDRKLTLICGSYFDAELGEESHDFALSTYSLHHFSEDEKTALYARIRGALKDGGVYVEGDYTCKTPEEQRCYLEESARLRAEAGVSGGAYHIDTPFTAETQLRLLKTAGFKNVRLVRAWESTSLITAEK